MPNPCPSSPDVKRPAIVLLLLAAALPAIAQPTKYGPLAARLPASARALAMGNIAVAGRDDDVIFYNPSQLVIARGTSMSFARMSPDARGGTMSTVLRLGSGGLGFGVNYLEYRADPSIYPITRDDVLQAGALGASTLATLGFAQVIKGFRIGAAANYAADQIGSARHHNVLGDVGVSHDFLRYFTGALAVQHLGGRMKEPGISIEPPMKATLGVAGTGPVGPLDVVVTTALSSFNEGHLSGGLGAEVGWSWLSGYSIAGRAGVRQPREPGEAAATAGFGFVADRLAVDVAAEFFLKGDRVGYRAGFRIR